jgi:hypothetical protein
MMMPFNCPCRNKKYKNIGNIVDGFLQWLKTLSAGVAVAAPRAPPRDPPRTHASTEAEDSDDDNQRWYPLGLTDAVTGGACEVDWLTDAVAGGACEVDWTWLSASVRGRGPFLFVDEYLFAFIHWPFKVSKTVTRP